VLDKLQTTRMHSRDVPNISKFVCSLNQSLVVAAKSLELQAAGRRAKLHLAST
jgi:hypothetical protein